MSSVGTRRSRRFQTSVGTEIPEIPNPRRRPSCQPPSLDPPVAHLTLALAASLSRSSLSRSAPSCSLPPSLPLRPVPPSLFFVLFSASAPSPPPWPWPSPAPSRALSFPLSLFLPTLLPSIHLPLSIYLPRSLPHCPTISLTYPSLPLFLNPLSNPHHGPCHFAASSLPSLAPSLTSLPTFPFPLPPTPPLSSLSPFPSSFPSLAIHPRLLSHFTSHRGSLHI